MASIDLLSTDTTIACRLCSEINDLDFQECQVSGRFHTVESDGSEQHAANYLFDSMVLTQSELRKIGTVNDSIDELTRITVTIESNEEPHFSRNREVIKSDPDIHAIFKGFFDTDALTRPLFKLQEEEEKFDEETEKEAKKLFNEERKSSSVKVPLERHTEIIQQLYADAIVRNLITETAVQTPGTESDTRRRFVQFVKLFPEDIFSKAKSFIPKEKKALLVDELEPFIQGEVMDRLSVIIAHVRYQYFINALFDRYDPVYLILLALSEYRAYVGHELEQGTPTTPMKHFYNAALLDDILRVRVPMKLLQNHEKTAERRHFLNVFIYFKKVSKIANDEFIAHIKRYILIKMLKRNNSLTALTAYETYKDKYLSQTTLYIKEAHNHGYDIELAPIVLRYKFDLPENSGFGKRTATQYGNRSYDPQLVYDLFHLYTTFQTSEDVIAIVYKDKADNRAKTNSPKVQVPEEPSYTDYFAIYFKSEDDAPKAPAAKSGRSRSRTSRVLCDMNKMSASEKAAIIKASTDRNKLVFDLSTGKCYITGTRDTIELIRRTFKDSTGIDLENPEFISYESSFNVKTKAVLSKTILSECLRLPTLAKYWIVKSVGTMANNYAYVYTPDAAEIVQTTTDEYISLDVEAGKRVNLLDNNWTVKFSGNKQSYFVPFVSMFIALIQLLDNADRDPRLEDFFKWQTELLDSYAGRTRIFDDATRKMKELKVSTTDLSLKAYAYHEISKREVYNFALRIALPDSDDINEYENQSKPFWVMPGIEGNQQAIDRWKRFYASAIAGLNPILRYTADQKAANSKNIPLQDKHKLWIYLNETSMRSQPYIGLFDELQVNTLEFVLRASGSRFEIGIVFQDAMFLTYPEKSVVHLIGFPTNGTCKRIPIRTQRVIRLEGNIADAYAPKTMKTTQRKKGMQGSIAEIVRAFSLQPSSISEYNPADGKKFYEEFLRERYRVDSTREYDDNRVLKALVAQHTWDIPKEEIHTVLQELDIELQQDLLQNLEGALILYYEYDSTTKEYHFKFPRHKLWYAVNTSYKKVMFIFRSRQSKNEHGTLEVANFVNPQPESAKDKEIKTTAINEHVLSFFKTIYISRQRPTFDPVSFAELERLPPLVTLGGQFFDANGKCVGFRFRQIDVTSPRMHKIMDIRISPQEPIFFPYNYREMGMIDGQLGYLSDVRTNVDEKGVFIDWIEKQLTRDQTTIDPITGVSTTNEVPNRFTLIAPPDRVVKYNIREIHQRARDWKQQVYLFVRMVITHWILAGTPPDIATHVEIFIQESDKTRTLVAVQDLERAALLPQFKSRELPDKSMSVSFLDFCTYLEQAYPNRFYENTFHVDNTPAPDGALVAKSDLEKMRAYLIREITLIKNCSPAFYEAFLNTRIDHRFIKLAENEIVGPYNLARVKEVFGLRQTLSSDELCFYTDRFTKFLDPLRVINRGDDIEKAQANTKSYRLVLTHIYRPVEGQRNRARSGVTTREAPTYTKHLVLIRVMASYHITTAFYICDLWARDKRIGSYDETATMATAHREFYIGTTGMIEETKTNKHSDIRETGQDYWILRYDRGPHQAFAAMLRLD